MSYHFLAPLPVTITSNTDSVICVVNATVTLTCHAPNAIQYNWTTTGDANYEPTDDDTIVVIATPKPIQYTCTATDGDGNTGRSSATVVSNGMFSIEFMQGAW